MDNGTRCCRARMQDPTYAKPFSRKGDGEWTMEHDTLPAPGAACATEIVLLMGGRWRWQWRMEKDLSHLVPAAWARITSDAHILLPMGRRTMGNGANGGSNDPWKDIQ